MTPRISVVMPVFNGEKYLKKAIESILNQTFLDFEFLIINDGSTDKSVEIIESYNDPRIRLVHNEQNLGLIATLNRGLNLCKGEYIVRMDADDISLPSRLEKQVKFLDFNPDIAICGTLLKTFGNISSSILKYPEKSESIKSALLFNCPIAHPSVMMKRSAIKGLYYDSSYKHAEDYQLWTRASKYLKLFNIQEVLLLYRTHPKQVSQDHLAEQLLSSKKIMQNQLKNLGIEPTEEELELHNQIAIREIQSSKEFVNRAEKWLINLIKANRKTVYYSEQAFSDVITEQWFLLCKRESYRLGVWSFIRFISSPLSWKGKCSIIEKIKFLICCLLRENEKNTVK